MLAARRACCQALAERVCFAGGQTNFTKDTSFSPEGWTTCESRNAAVFIAGDSATRMGRP